MSFLVVLMPHWCSLSRQTQQRKGPPEHVALTDSVVLSLLREQTVKRAPNDPIWPYSIFWPYSPMYCDGVEPRSCSEWFVLWTLHYDA
eukprot:5977769-Amphidinium_carterae.1